MLIKSISSSFHYFYQSNLFRTMIKPDLYSPALNKDIETCINSLLDAGYYLPAAEYLQFLKQTDGWHYNGNYLFGTTEHEHIPSLLKANQRFGGAAYLNNRLIIGREDEGWFLYDYPTKQFLIVDRIDGLVYESFYSFDLFFAYLSR